MSEPTDDQRIRSLASTARSLGRSVRLDVMVEIAAEQAVEALGAASVSISRLEPATGVIRTLINVGSLGPREQRWPEHEVYRLTDFSQLQAVVTDLRIWTMAVGDPAADPQEVNLLKSLRKSSSMGAPLVVDGVLWGELYATRGWDDSAFSETDQAYTEALSAILAGAVSRALHVDSLEQMAFRDPLTGLSNRRALDEAVQMAFDPVSGRSGRRVTVVALDMNGLKSVNDRHGHAEGDRLLVQVGRLLDTHFSTLHGSLVARVGGDEFTVLVSGHELSPVLAAAEMVCQEACQLSIGAGLSCGVASTSDAGTATAQQLLDAADLAQYTAKRQGQTTPRAAAVPFDYETASVTGQPAAGGQDVSLRDVALLRLS